VALQNRSYTTSCVTPVYASRDGQDQSDKKYISSCDIPVIIFIRRNQIVINSDAEKNVNKYAVREACNVIVLSSV